MPRPVMKSGLPVALGTSLEHKLEVYRQVTPQGCWEWQGYVDPTGYGTTTGRDENGKQKRLLIHRVSYQTYVGDIPTGMTLDHLCRNTKCFNPNHLEVVTQRENTLRGTSPTAVNAQKTHCVRGHEFTPENTYWTPRGRHCRACQQERDHAYKARKRAKRSV